MAQSVAYFSGFETGDTSELNDPGTCTVQGSTVRTGAYALKADSGGATLIGTLSATQTVVRVWVYCPSLPGSTSPLIIEAKSGGVARALVNLKTDGTLQVADNGSSLGLSTTGGSHAISTNTWTMVEFALDLAAGGVVKTWVSGVLDINTTHSSDVSANTTVSYLVSGLANPNQYFYDDVRVDTGGLAEIGTGKTVARQGKTGTPTYNAWTKNGDTTAANCWSETPYSTGKNCTSSTGSAAQTMLVEKFSITQSGHGSEVINSVDAVNACKVSLVVQGAGVISPSIRRRVAGTDTDTAKTLTTSDAYYDDGVWTTAAGNLDSLEAGIVKDASATLATVEDVWVMVEYRSASPRTVLVAIM